MHFSKKCYFFYYTYEYQQINDVEEIDPWVWREWTNLFKNNESVLYKQPEESLEKKESQSILPEKEGQEKEEEKKESVEEENKESKEKTEENKVDTENQNQNTEEKKQEDESIHIDINSRYNKTFYSIFNTGDTSCTKLDQILDECEFYEYQNNKGQWLQKLFLKQPLYLSNQMI